MTASTGKRRKRNSTKEEVLAYLDTKSVRNEDTGCLECTLAKTDGYPRVHWQGRDHGVHRFTFEAAHGPLSPGQQVLHRCDNRACRELEHLFAGTHADNMADKAAKGRGWRGGRPSASSGENHPRAKLTAELAAAIRVDPRKQAEIAETYGVSPATVSHIKTGRKWK